MGNWQSIKIFGIILVEVEDEIEHEAEIEVKLNDFQVENISATTFTILLR